jgi:single-stranded-DNA-specific exonuclease
MDKYSRPTIVLSRREDGLAKGSARSIDGFHLVEALQECQQYLTKFGGHAKAAGLTLAQDHLELLYDALINIAEKKLADDDLLPKLKIDAVLRDHEVTISTAEQLARLEPHGLGNPKALFAIEGVTVVASRAIGQTGKHLKLSLRLVSGETIDGVAFGMAARSGECEPGAVLDVAGVLDVNVWQNRRSVQIKLLDWRPADKASTVVSAIETSQMTN